MVKRPQSGKTSALPDLYFENFFWEAGIQLVAGIDEAGRGALAGPVAAAVIILPTKLDLCQILHGVRDSKQITPRERDIWASRLKEVARAYAIGFASHEEIDERGILPATRLAVQRALEGLQVMPHHLLLDYLTLPECPLTQTALVKGDCRSLSIAGASILAKTARDELMRQLDRQFPGYGFAMHKGYGTPAHHRALTELGFSPIHRKTFHVKT